MALFIIENSYKNLPSRRLAFIYAKDQEQAVKKLYEKFPNSANIRFIRPDQINQSFSTCFIK